jgi:hypothetical protein
MVLGRQNFRNSHALVAVFCLRTPFSDRGRTMWWADASHRKVYGRGDPAPFSTGPGFAMVGFQLTLHARIWVTPEGQRRV